MTEAHLSLILHAHLPFVRHPEYDQFLEERWYFEALSETYLPILHVLRELEKDQVPCQFNISISPSLLSMMDDELLSERYLQHIENMTLLAQLETDRQQDNGHFKWLAEYYLKHFTHLKSIFTFYETKVWRGFKHYHEAGLIELMTSTATHGLLPLLAGNEKSLDGQLQTGLNYFQEIFGFAARGLWLPECGFMPGLDAKLSDQGIRYFIGESHAIEHANPAPCFGVHAPVYTESGVAVFSRDQSCAKEVWSAREGFPGDSDYREFYRDLGHDADLDTIKPFICGDVRVDTGIKYFRITGHTAHKEGYDPIRAREKAALHAGEFVYKRQMQLDHLKSNMDTTPLVTAPFDAELFGHWWYEGPTWLDFVIRKTAYDQKTFRFTTLSNYLDHNPVHQTATPCTSTWGHEGYFEFWLNDKTDWMYNDLQQCAKRMVHLATLHKTTRSKWTRRALNQCARELLLAQSSDWPFIISGQTTEIYAKRRINDHVKRFHFLADQVDSGQLNTKQVSQLEEIDRIFEHIDFRVYAY